MQTLVPASLSRLPIQWALLFGCLLVVGGLASKVMAADAIHTIVIECMQYSPAHLEVKLGDTVVWENKDPFPHTATSNDKTLDSGNIESGQAWKYQTKTKGSFPYICTLHPTMKATLVVK